MLLLLVIYRGGAAESAGRQSSDEGEVGHRHCAVQFHHLHGPVATGLGAKSSETITITTVGTVVDGGGG